MENEKGKTVEAASGSNDGLGATSPREELFKALDKFHLEFMHGCPVAESTLPGFMDPRNELALAVFRFARQEFGWQPTSA